MTAWPLVTLAALGVPPAAAFDWAVFKDPPPERFACLLEHLDAGEVKTLVAGVPPADRALDRRGRAAWRRCTCPSAPIPYRGVMFDARARPDHGIDMAATLDGVLAAGVDKVALAAGSEPDDSRLDRLLDGRPDLAVDAARTVDGWAVERRGGRTAAQIATLLDRRPQVVVALTWRDVSPDVSQDGAIAAPVVDSCGRLRPEWRSLLLLSPERLLFASGADRPEAWADYGHRVATWRALLGRLPADTAEAIAYRTAERVYGVVAAGP